MPALTQDQRDFFSENGYLAYGKVLDDGHVETLRGEYDREFMKANDDGSFQNLTVEWNADLEKKRGAKMKMLQIMQVCERNLHFRRLLFNEKILDVVESLIGPNIMLFHDQALFKPARTGGAVTWHQDNGYWKCSPANLVSCWITLDDVIRDNGAMQVIPRSHLKPVWHDDGNRKGALLDVEQTIDPGKAVVVDLPAGGCMFHHCQTLHYTQPNETDRQRRAFAIHFMTPGTRDMSGNVMRVGFGRPMLRMMM